MTKECLYELPDWPSLRGAQRASFASD